MCEISVKTMDTKAHRTSWLVNTLTYWELNVPYGSPWGESVGALYLRPSQTLPRVSLHLAVPDLYPL